MIVYYARIYEASVAGTNIRCVVCAKCSCEFFYELKRVGTGSASSTYGLNNRGAQRTSADNASRELFEMLKYCHDPVACPNCGFIQKKMRWQAAVTRARKWIVNAVVTILFATFVSMIVLVSNRTPPWGWWCFLGLVILLLLFAYRTYVVKRRYDEESFSRIPASDFNLLAPPALVVGESGDGYVVLVPAKPSVPRHAGATLIEQLVRVGLPPFCLRCLAKTDNAYKPPLAVASEQIYLPCCDACAKLLWRRTMFTALSTWIVQAIMVWSLVRWCGMDEVGQWMATIIYSIIPGSIISVTLASAVGSVAHLRDVDAWRGWGSLRTTPEVTAQLVAYYSLPQVHSVRCDAEELERLRRERTGGG